MEVLVEEDEVLPKGVLRVSTIIPVTGAASLLVSQEEQAEATRKFIGYLLESHESPASRWTFDGEGVPVEGVVAIERLNHEEVNGEPHRSTPVGVASEEIGV
jgi:hypothetical protein